MNKNALVTCLLVASFLNAADAMAASSRSSGHFVAGRQSQALAALAEAKSRHSAGPVPGNRVHTLAGHVPMKNGLNSGLKAPAKPFVIAIDAGHGGKDTGAIGYNGTFEKDVVYAIARKLERLVRVEPGMRSVMVRRGDRFIGLRQRAEIARQVGADLFISIHADANTDGDAKGSAVFILSPRRVEYGDLAENALESDRAAGKILGELRKRQYLHCRHVQKARFEVLKSPDVPSLLIETGFVTNPEEERQLASPAYQEKVARSIFNGIRAYFRVVEPVPGKFAEVRPVLVASRQ